MATIRIITPNTSKSYTLDAAQVQRLIDFATLNMEGGDTATQIQKEEWLAFTLFATFINRVDNWERRQKQAASVSTHTKIPVVDGGP